MASGNNSQERQSDFNVIPGLMSGDLDSSVEDAYETLDIVSESETQSTVEISDEDDDEIEVTILRFS